MLLLPITNNIIKTANAEVLINKDIEGAILDRIFTLGKKTDGSPIGKYKKVEILMLLNHLEYDKDAFLIQYSGSTGGGSVYGKFGHVRSGRREAHDPRTCGEIPGRDGGRGVQHLCLQVGRFNAHTDAREHRHRSRR